MNKKEHQEHLARLAEQIRAEMEKPSIFSSLERDVEEEKQRFAERLLAEKLAALPPEENTPKPCPWCKQPVRVRAKAVARTVATLHGEHTIRRNAHYCEHCKKGFCPRDEELGLPADGNLSSDLEARIADFAVNDTYEAAEARWALHYPFPASANLFRQVAKRLGQLAHEVEPAILQAALRAPEPSSTQTLYVMVDQSMLPVREDGGWKEAKVGAVFRAEHHVASTAKARGFVTEARYTAVLGSQSEFSGELDVTIAIEKGASARRTVWLGDGAPENWTLAGRLCPTAVQVLDWYHAVENGMRCARALKLDEEPALYLQWQRRLESLLFEPDPSTLLSELQACLQGADDDEKEALSRLITYYRKNKERIRYATFRDEGLLIGSGIVESAHRHVLQVRMKRAGQHWSMQGARSMCRLRAAYRTAGPIHFHQALRKAHWMTPKTKKNQRPKRRASNR